MHVGGITMDLNWLLQFIFTVFVIGLGLLHLVKNTASKYFEAAESNHTVIDPCTVNQAMEAEDGCCRCVNCGSFGTQRCSRCKSVIYCSLRCQKKHWKAGHRLKCKDFGASSSRTAKSNSKPIIEKPGVITNPNFWEDPVRGTDSHNGWGAAVASTHSAAGGGGWMDEAPREDYNGWGAAVASTHSAAGGGGWMDEAPREGYNGWGVPNMGPSGSQGHVFETSSGNTSSAPSAPPIPDGAFDEEPIHHPSIDFSPPELSVLAIEHGASVTSDVNEGGTSSCIICWEAPVEGACNPCGHMAGCMACLSEIKAKKGVCPVCRSNINQLLRLYAV